ncbi:hypothetical protein N9W79_02590 [bacterium]|nr:hypothetical protein [bacterium]
MVIKPLLIAAAFLGSTFSFGTILPENNLHLEDNLAITSNITQDDFFDIIEKVEDYYKPVVATHGGNLRIEKRWLENTVNAYALRRDHHWIVSMFGGLARRPEVTPDGFMLVVCHELGHHLAGFPFAKDWASNEGQSDFFATQVCAKNMWKDDVETNALSRDSINPTAKDTCDAVYSDEADQNLCYRSANAGKSLATLLAVLNKQVDPAFETPDTSSVSKTYDKHPEAQCRLDTYVNGALCTTEFDDFYIPGLKYGKWHEKKKAEKDSIKYSCSQKNSDHVLSQRPKCWFNQTTKG